ncbi:hypothetical protein [Spirosoma aerophilum]
MNQYFTFLIFLLVRVASAQAQTVFVSNATYPVSKTETALAVPYKTKAMESPLYLKAYGFYSLLSPGTKINYSSSQSQSSSPTIYKPINTRLGSGLRAGIGVGVLVSDFINIGIDAEILFGTAIKATSNFYSGSGTALDRYAISTTTNLQVVSIIPNITFKALSRPTFYIYNRLGLIGGVVLDYKIGYNTLINTSKGGINTSISTATYTKNSLSVGYQAALGIQFRLSQSLRGFVEVVGYNQSFKPREVKGFTTSSSGAGTTVYESATVYKDQGDYNKSDPYEQPSFNVAINSVGVGAGLVFRF